jgi:hypothetical protein
MLKAAILFAQHEYVVKYISLNNKQMIYILCAEDRHLVCSTE